MPRLLPAGTRLGILSWTLTVALSAAQSTTSGVADAGGYPAPTAALERGRAVYVLNHCHFCHGTDLRRAVMGASDLLRSPLVGADQDGELIGAVVRAGRPNLQTAMPRYGLTPAETTELARYIHYLRQVGRYADLSGQPRTAPDRAAGAAYFARRCASCHAVEGDLKGVAQRYDAATLVQQMLRPRRFASPVGSEVGRREHLQLLEQYAETDVSNLLGYLENRAR